MATLRTRAATESPGRWWPMLGEAFADVLTRAAAGDQAAFALLWRDAQPLLLRYLTVLSPTHAEDLASETWIAAIAGLGRFSGDEAAFRGWLVTIARNKHHDLRRRQARRPETSSEELDAAARPRAADAADEALEAMTTREALRLIASLPPEQAEMVALRVVMGLDVADVARIVGRRPGTVRVAVHRGLRRLADTLGEQAVTRREPATFRGRDV